MQVIYKKKIIEQIIDVKTKAELDNKVIEKIELTKEEWDQLCNDLGVYFYNQCVMIVHLGKITYKGVINGIVVECAE